MLQVYGWFIVLT